MKNVVSNTFSGEPRKTELATVAEVLLLGVFFTAKRDKRTPPKKDFIKKYYKYRPKALNF